MEQTRDQLPTGTVTFLFTDVEDSTGLVQRMGSGSDAVIERQAEIVKAAVVEQGGTVVRTEGDGVFAAFGSAPAAVRAAVAAQRALAAESWPGGQRVAVRMGLHTGEGRLGGDDYLGIDVHEAARIGAAAHGEQIVVSDATRALVASDLPLGATLTDLGSHVLKGLPEAVRIHQVTVDGLRPDFPPLQTEGSRPNNLPAELTSFVGREADLDAISRLLADCRLVTLTGPGGTGKTRLALRVAAHVADRFRGVYFVPLASLADADLVASGILSTLGLTNPVQDPTDRLRSYLADKEWLLVLDNFEHVLDAAPLVASLLTSAPDLRVLITSRAPLRIEGEHEYAVPTLVVPQPGTAPTPDELARLSSVQLFVERARSIRPDFVLDENTAPAVAELTSLLDGLPLALELAATWLRLFWVEAVVERLRDERTLDVSGRRDLPERQRTLRTAIQWSYDLLDDDVQDLFERLSVFAGGADLTAVEAVSGTGDVVDGLTTLVDHSLVKAFDESGLPRFTMLQTIRQFAGERLEERGVVAEVRDAHLHHFHGMATELGPRLEGQDRSGALDRLDREIDNIRAALAWGVESGQADLAAHVVGAIWRYWHMRGSTIEGRSQIERVLAAGPESDAGRLAALEAAGGIAYWQNDLAAAEGFYTEAVEVAERLDDPMKLARAAYNLSFPLLFGGRYDESVRTLERALAIHREADNEAGVAEVLWGIGAAEWERRQLEPALASFREALQLYRRLDDTFMLAWTLRMIGASFLDLRNPAEARPYLEEGMKLFSQVGDVSGIVYHLRDFAELLLLEGHHERAVTLAGAVRAAVESSGLELIRQERNRLSDPTEAIAVLGADRVTELEAYGRTLNLEQAAAVATSTGPLAT